MKENNKIDTITMDIPLFIRMLEFAKEDAETDMDLHSATERAIKLCKSGKILGMSNYNNIVGKKQVEAKEQTMSPSSGSFDGSSNVPIIKRKVTKINNTKTPEIDMKEITDASSSGAFDVPLFGSTKGRKDPLSIGGEKTIGQTIAVKDKNFPKWGGPDSEFIKINDKCKKFPYCNQGDKNAVEMLEIKELKEAIILTSKKHGLPQKHVQDLIIKKIITENVNDFRSHISYLFHNLDSKTEKNEITNKGLLNSMKMIGDGEIETNKYQEHLKYTEQLSDDLTLVVYGRIAKPVMTYGYSYEIKILSGPSTTTQHGGGFGSSGFITKNKQNVFQYDTYQNVYFNETIIPEVCKVIRNKFTQEN